MAFHILLEANMSQEYLILPLKYAKEHDQYEASRYMQPFSKYLVVLTTPSTTINSSLDLDESQST